MIKLAAACAVAVWLAACAAPPEKADDGKAKPPKWGPWVEFGTGVGI